MAIDKRELEAMDDEFWEESQEENEHRKSNHRPRKGFSEEKKVDHRENAPSKSDVAEMLNVEDVFETDEN